MSRVLFVVASFVNFSGAEGTLVDYLKESTDENYILVIGDHKDNCKCFSGIVPEDHFYFWNYNQYRNTSLTRFFLMNHEAKRVRRAYRESQAKKWVDQKKVDVVYLNNTLENALFRDMFQEYPTVSHVHDMVRHLRPAWGRCGARACKKSAAVITPSEAAAKELASFAVSQEKIHVVYNGVDLQSTEYHRSYDTGTLTFGFVGGVSVRKGFDILVEIVNLVAEKCGDFKLKQVKLMIITNSEEDDYYRKCMGKLNQSVQVEVFHKLEHAQVAGMYQKMDILLVPSRNDPAPLVVAEGISMGCCVLGARCDGIPEMLWSEALVFAKEDAADAARCTGNWLKKTFEEQQNIISSCQNFVKERFNAQAKCVAIQRIIKETGRK